MNKQNHLAAVHHSGKPYIIYKSKKGFDLYTNFSKKIVLNNKNISNFLSQRHRSKSKNTDLFIGFFGYELLNNLINIKIPKLDHFIHRCYIQTARDLWKNPYLFNENVNRCEYQKNMRECNKIIDNAINEVIRKQLPVRTILKEYLGELYVQTNRIGLAKERLDVLVGCNCEEYKELKELIENN